MISIEKITKIKLRLQKQFTKYLHASFLEKIIALTGFGLYLFLMPQLLFRIIPQKYESNQYFDRQAISNAIYVISLILCNQLTVLFYAIFMYFVYTKKMPYLEKYRISPNKLWPWEEDAQKWHKLFVKTVKTLLINTNIYGFGSLVILVILFPRKVILSQQMPDYFTIFWQMMLFFVVQDFTSTFTHTLLHSRSLYWIHKKHHQYTTSVSIAAQYAHPIQFIFSNSLPTLIGFKTLAHFYPVHLISALTWLIFRILLTSDLHCGYSFPWDFYRLIPFAAPSSYHDYHHSHNVGNFASSLMIIQAISGNNDEYYKFIEGENREKSK